MAQLTWYISAQPISNNDNTGGEASLGGGYTKGTIASQESTNQRESVAGARSMAQILAVTTAKRSINYLTSNVGKWTGNSRNQRQVDAFKTAVGYGIAFSMNPLLGVATVAMDGLTNVLDYVYEQRNDRARVDNYNVRTGGKGGYRK